MTDPALDLDAIEAELRGGESPLIHVALYVPALVAEVRRLRAQRDAALAAVDESNDLTPTMLLRRSVRAALGVQPEPDNG